VFYFLMLISCGPEIPSDPYDACVAMYEQICQCDSELCRTDGYDQQCDANVDYYPDDIWECLIEEAGNCPESLTTGDTEEIFRTCQE
jgi:hypothetical protein